MRIRHIRKDVLVHHTRSLTESDRGLVGVIPVTSPSRTLIDLGAVASAAVVEEAFARGEKAQSGTPFEMPWPLGHWPEVPTRFLLCRDDRFFPAEFLRRVVVERLGIVPDEMGGGHLPALGRPKELASRLEAYRVG